MVQARETLGGQILDPPIAVSWGPGRIDLFAVGTTSWDRLHWQPTYDDGWAGPLGDRPGRAGPRCGLRPARPDRSVRARRGSRSREANAPREERHPQSLAQAARRAGDGGRRRQATSPDPLICRHRRSYQDWEQPPTEANPHRKSLGATATGAIQVHVDSSADSEPTKVVTPVTCDAWSTTHRDRSDARCHRDQIHRFLLRRGGSGETI